MNLHGHIGKQWALFGAFLCLACPNLARSEAMLQLFNVSWAEITQKMPELAEAGYTSLWCPPPSKGSGGLSVGYDNWDPFDLGSKDQKGSVRTRYGTEAELLHMVEVAHRFGIRVYFDNIMNHRAFDVPGYNENTPIDTYPGMVPEDFHLRKTEDGFYRKWDNTRDWSSAWQVQNLGLSDLVDIAHETPNANHGTSEGATHPKMSLIRHPNNPEYYAFDKDGNYVGFGNVTSADLAANPARYREDVGAYLIRTVRWFMDRTKADGLRLDAVKHVPDYFFGAQGADKDTSDAGYTGGAQRQFNLTRGFTDANHRDSVFEEDRPRDDAMMFGEHLGQPPGYSGYWDAGMRLVDNDLRSKLNGTLGNSGATLYGLDSPGAGGFAAGLGITHANSHDNDYAAQKEWQHAYYMTREGMGLIYSDGYYQAETLGESGGAFPRHANTAFLGQFNDPRIPNILKIHQDFARGMQQGRWGDADYLAFERRDNRYPNGTERIGGNAGEEITMVVMMNDNTAQGQARGITTSFWGGAYLHQYARGPNGSSMVGFETYASNLPSVVVPPGGYFVFGWRTPELSTLWPNSAITLYQTNATTGQLEEVPRITVTRKDGPDGDASFNPYGLANRGYATNSTPVAYTYQTTVPVVKAGQPFTIIARADGSAENIRLKLDGGVDLNGSGDARDSTGKRDFPPGYFTDIYEGYEQPSYVGRQYAEKFAAKDTTRCQIGSPGAETFTRTIGGTGTINNGPTGANSSYNADNGNQASWVYHDPADDVGGITSPPKQFDESGSEIVIWAKSNSVGGGFQAFVYYTLDGTFPEGAGGIGRGTTRVAALGFRHNQTTDDWWASVNIPKPAAGTLFTYKIGFSKTGANSQWPSGPTEVTRKKNMLTTFRVANFNPSNVQFHLHNDYNSLTTGLKDGFHVLRARAFLNRDTNVSAPLYNTFTQTFYYDAQTPEATIAFPATNNSTIGGSSYEFVVRTDMTVQEVWYHIDDSDAGNNDAITRQNNGNGAGFEPFTDGNTNSIREAGEEYIDVNANRTYDTNLAVSWAKATEVTPYLGISNAPPREWRFRYVNIPATGQGTVTLRFLEASSSRNLTLSATDAHVTEITNTVATRGPDQRVNIAWPQNDGDRVDDNYSMKVYFTKSLSWDITEEQLKNRFTFFANGVAQDRTGWTVNYGDFGGGAFHELSIPLPNLYNDVAAYTHQLRVVHTLTNNVQLEAVRLVKATPSTKPFVRITQPAVVGSDGKPIELLLEDRPGTDELIYPVRVQTSASVTSLALSGSPAITLYEEPYVDANFNGIKETGEFTDSNGNGVWDGTNVTVSGSTKTWDMPWKITEPGIYNLIATGSGSGIPTTTGTRTVTVLLRQTTTPDGDANNDDDHDGLSDSIESNVSELSGNAEDWTNGNVHLAKISGRSLPTSPDSDGDGLPDGLELGWQVAISPPTDTTRDFNGDGSPNFIGDLDPPLYAVVEYSGYVPGVGSVGQGDDRTRLAFGSITDPSKADTDNDGILDGAEDANKNGWTDGDGKSLPLTSTRTQFAAARPNTGDWPNNTIESYETWTETSPTKADSDGDSLLDGYGEDKSGNGRIDGDTDNDRAYDAGETWTETNPLKSDTDGDGLPDGWEDQYGLDPLDNGTDNYRTGTANDGNPRNGGAGDPDEDGFTNAQELASGSNPTQISNPGGGGGEGVIRIGQFMDWTHNDLLVLDEYNENGSNQGADVYRTNGNDSSRDILAFSFRDGGDPAQGGNGLVYFRLDFMDLSANAWEGEVDAYIVIDTGNTGAGERALPNGVDIATDMKWEVVVAAYGQNYGSVFVDTNPASSTTTDVQDPLSTGVVARGQAANGFSAIAWSSTYDAVEIAVQRQALKDAGWQGDPATLNFQVFTTLPNTSSGGTGDLAGRNDLRDTIYDDWVVSDYWKDSDNVKLNAKLSGYFGRSSANDRMKCAKVMLLAHANQSISPGKTTQGWIHNLATTNPVGYFRLLDTHDNYDAPLTLHLTPTLASGLQWAKSSDPRNDGPAFNARIRNLISQGIVDLTGSTFSDHVVKYFPQSFNNADRDLARDFLDQIYGNGSPVASRQVFWTPERVLDDETLALISGMGYGYTFADQMRHFVKWFGRNSALSTDGFRLNEVNGVKIFPIHDFTSDYLDQTLDNGSSLAVRQLLSRRSRSGTQDQVVVLWRDLGDFANLSKASSYDANVRWLASRPWIRVVTAGQIVGGQIGYRGTDGNAYTNWGTVTRGTSQNLAQTAKDWVDWASNENYDNWFNKLKTETFSSGTAFGQVGVSGIANSAASAVSAVTSTSLTSLARSVLHGAMFQTGFFLPNTNQTTDLQKFSTGDYINPASLPTQPMADFARRTQSQARSAKIYEFVNGWATTANSTTLTNRAVDVDLDGANEYLLYNSRLFGVFETKGGRMTAAWMRDPATGKIWQVAGNLAAYANTETEDEGTDNATAYRTSGFKDWYLMPSAGTGNRASVNGTYTAVAAEGGTGWTFSNQSDVTKTITLASTDAKAFTASYSLSGLSKAYIRFGLSPNLQDLLLRGQTGLGSEVLSNTNRRVTLTNTSGSEVVRAFVEVSSGGTINPAASDLATEGTTMTRRNQAQTHQVEVELTGDGALTTTTHVITLGFDDGTDTPNPDSDADGLLDSWETSNFGDLSQNGSGDPDGDGINNLLEYRLGSNPNSASSNGLPALNFNPADGNGMSTNGFKISFPTATNLTYQVVASTNLSTNSWGNVGSSVAGDGTTKSVTDTSATNSVRKFYRINISVP